ncbi:glycosyltransferase family 9 protein [Merismopedia glauca]|uniref:Glycosyltransferase n=1 Tax=Merismopedia glauca CCAP 1448/3 TaxID=1296344 RepID=A0A2T1BXY9_9CYAN|nr:glycosyltransferase family 9 protein [Merismopedia glauca]PSB00886.1 glycosyltransferase [Merismopedia glauca CCAP 1448/3]
MRTLFLVPGGIGEQILLFPTLEALKCSYPDAEIDVIVEPRAKAAYQVCKSVHDVFIFNFADRNGLADWGNLLGIIRDREYEAVVSIDRSWGIGFLLWMTGIPTRVTYKGGAGSWFFSNTVPLKSKQYVADMYHDLLYGLGITAPCPHLEIKVTKSDLDWAQAEQDKLGIKDSGYILISDEETQLEQGEVAPRLYPVKKWQQIIDSIAQKQPNLPIVLIQEPEDTQWASSLKTSCPNVQIITPPDLGKLAATIAAANLVICTDSIPMYLSVAVGTYAIALLPSGTAEKRLPKHDSRIRVLQSLTDSIVDISPADVLEKIWQS